MNRTELLQGEPTPAICRAYDAVFAAIRLTVELHIAEVRQLAPGSALARTNSAGKVKVHATGESAPEGNQELFLFQKVGGDWKIARYCFSTTNPPGGPGLSSIVSAGGGIRSHGGERNSLRPARARLMILLLSGFPQTRRSRLETN
jgi:hypothetical protein